MIYFVKIYFIYGNREPILDFWHGRELEEKVNQGFDEGDKQELRGLHGDRGFFFDFFHRRKLEAQIMRNYNKSSNYINVQRTGHFEFISFVNKLL